MFGSSISYSPMPHVILKDYPYHLSKYEGKGTSRIPILKLFSKLGKTWKCSLGFSKIPNFYLFYELGKTWKYTQPKTNISKSKFWIYGWIGKRYVLIYSSLLKIRWGIHIKKDGHILNLTEHDWYIPFPKTLRIYQWIGKTFSIWENGMNSLDILPIQQNIWSKGTEDIYF